MKVLKAPHSLTIDQITSEGEIHFEDGIATEFTKEQAQHLCENIPGYEVVEIADKEPEVAAPKTVPEKEVPPKTETTSVKEPAAAVSGAAEEEVKEEAPASEEKEAPEEDEPTIYAKVVNRSVVKAKKFIIREFGEEGISDEDKAALIEAEKADKNRPTFILWLEEFVPISPAPAEEKGEQLETSTDTEGEGSGEPEVEAGESGEAESGLGEGEEGAEPTGEEYERGQEDPPEGKESQSDESGGQEDGAPPVGETVGEGAAKKEITLPVIQDDISVIQSFAKEHGIIDDGDKGEILKLIYADPRFKS